MRALSIMGIVGVVIVLVLVLGVSHVAMAEIVTITPTYNTSIVSTVQASFSFSSIIAPSIDFPLYVYIPGSVYLGWYSDGNYYASLNFTITFNNTSTSSVSDTLHIVCPFASISVPVTVGASTTTYMTFTLRANINGTVQQGQTIQCQVYSGTGNLPISAVTIQLPVEVANYKVVNYNGLYYPAFTVQFNAPYLVFSGTSTTYKPRSLSIVPFGGLSIGSQLYLVQTSTSASDNSIFSLPTPTSAGQTYNLTFIITTLNTFYEIIPAVLPFIPYAHSIFTSPLDWDLWGIYGMQGITIPLSNGVNMITIYASPNGITIVPYGKLVAYYTNSSRYFTYPVIDLFFSNNFNETDTGIAFPVAPGSNNKFWLLAFVISPFWFGSKLVVPELYMFNVVNPGYTVDTTLFTIVNGTTNAPLPRGLSLSATITPNGNYTLVSMTLSTPIANITNKMILFEMYFYTNTSNWYYSESFIMPIANPTEPNITTTWWDWIDTINEYMVVGWAIYNVSVTPTPYLRVLKTAGFAANSLSNVYLTPVVNMTVINNAGTPLPTLRVGLSLNVTNATMGRNYGATLVYTNQWGDYLYTQLTDIDIFDYFDTLTLGPDIVTTPHLFAAFANVSNIYYFLMLAYPWGNMSVPIIEVFPNRTYVIVGNQSVPVLRPESVNEIFTYVSTQEYPWLPPLLMTGLIMTVAPILNVNAYYGPYAIPYVRVVPINYTGYCTPFVMTVPRHYVPLMCILNTTFPFSNYTLSIINYAPPRVISTKYLSMFGFRNIAWANYTYVLPNITDALIRLVLPKPPFFPVHRVNATPAAAKVYVGKTVSITVTVTLNYTAIVNETLEGYVYLNGSLVSTFNVTVPAGTNTTTTTVTFPAPSSPGTYNVTVVVGNQTSVTTLSVVAPTPTTTTPTPTPTLSGIIVYVIVATAVITVIAAAAYTKRHRKRLIRASGSGYV